MGFRLFKGGGVVGIAIQQGLGTVLGQRGHVVLAVVIGGPEELGTEWGTQRGAVGDGWSAVAQRRVVVEGYRAVIMAAACVGRGDAEAGALHATEGAVNGGQESRGLFGAHLLEQGRSVSPTPRKTGHDGANIGLKLWLLLLMSIA